MKRDGAKSPRETVTVANVVYEESAMSDEERMRVRAAHLLSFMTDAKQDDDQRKIRSSFIHDVFHSTS
jgi:hypothetical protein